MWLPASPVLRRGGFLRNDRKVSRRRGGTDLEPLILTVYRNRSRGLQTGSVVGFDHVSCRARGLASCGHEMTIVDPSDRT